MQVKKLKTEEERRKITHEILDLVLDINSCNSRRKELTGDMPTAFFEFNGNTASVRVEVAESGWEAGIRNALRLGTYLDIEDFADELEHIKWKLQEVKNVL